jgi:hypothetical protein
LAALLGAYACGGDGIVLPDESQPADLIAMDGDGQAAPAGGTLAEAVVVLVTDARGRPVADQQVSFTITVGGGQVAPASARTDADGLVSATWTLGPSAGAQRLRAQATGAGVPADLTVDFTATALAGTGSTLVLVSGDGQTGSVGSALADPLVVRVVDPLGNPVGGQTVNWSVTGGGSIDPASSVTGADGETSAQRVLGPTAGEQTALATADGLAGSPVSFTHTASASTPTSLVRISGDAQTAPAGFQLPDSLVVQLRDANGNGVGGRTVTWVVAAGGGVVDPVNSQTDQQGFAVTRWTLGPTAGSYTLNAVFSGLPSVPFAATATADVPTTLALLSGNGQTAPVGSALPLPLRVKVTDGNGNPVDNVSVTWAAVGGGSVSSTTTGTDGQGIAEVTRTLGATPGAYTTTATVAGLAGSPVTFTSTAEVGAPARLAFLSQPAGALVGQMLASFQVEIQDAQGNRVTTAANQVTITSSVAGTLVGDNSNNAVAGVATFDALALDEARNGYRFTARSSGLSDALSNTFDIAPGATTTDITGRSPTSSVTGQSVTVSYDVDATVPAAGNLTGNVTVSDGLGASCTGGTSNAGAGSCAIVFPTAGARTLTATYVDDPNFTGSTSPGVAVTVGKATPSVTITSDQPEPSGVGEAVTVAFTVSAAGGGVAPTGDVTVTASGGAETCSASVAAGSCIITLQAAGNRTLTANYPGDANYNLNSGTEPHAVRTATTTTVTTSKATSVFGESVTFTATVAPVPPGTDTPAGSVQFKADGVNLGAPVGLSGGSAARSTAALSVGSHVITAEYSPSGDFAASTGTLSPDQQVTQAGTTTAITGEDPEVSNPGESYSVSVTVSAAAPGSGTPGGTVSVTDSEGGSCQVNLSGGAGSCALASATPGTKTLTATYNGDTNFLGGSSTTAPHGVNTPPVAEGDAFQAPLGTVSVGEPGVLVNDTDGDGDGLTAVLDATASNGILLLFSNGGFTYTATPGFVGTDSFTYHAEDGRASSSTVTVTIEVP